MINETIISSGTNEFENNTFSSREWSAPTMVSPEEIRARLASFELVGRRIKEMRMIGLSYLLTRMWIENAAYNSLPHDMPEEERRIKANYDNIRPDLELSRHSEIDEPFLIRFEDGGIFEIETPQVPEYRFSMNCIPWSINAGTNQPNVDANILFEPCIGRKITEVAVNTCFTDKDPMYGSEFDDPSGKREIVSHIVLWLEGGIGICIEGYIDFCEVVCIDRNNDVLPITFRELKPALFNWEDMST